MAAETGNTDTSATDDTTEATAATSATNSDTSKADESELGDAGKRALQREREARRKAEESLKALKPKAEAYDKAAEAQKTAEQRAAEKLAEIERERDNAVASANRFRVASAKGLGEDLADVLGNGSVDDMEAIAEKLLKWRKDTAPAATADTGKRRPQPNNVQGTGASTGATSEGEQFAAWLNKRL